MATLLGNAFGIAEKVQNAAAKAQTLAHAHLGAMLETAEVEYDESGRALISADQVGRSMSEADSRRTATIDEREELRLTADDQVKQLHGQLSKRLELAEERRAGAEARAHGALQREEQLEQRLLSLEVQLSDEQVLRRTLQAECEELRALRHEHATSTEAAALALAAAVDAEAARWHGDIEELRSEKFKAQHRCEQLEQEVQDLSEAWQADQEALREQQQQHIEAHGGDGASGAASTSVAQAEAAASMRATRMLRATLHAQHEREMAQAVDEARATVHAEHKWDAAQAAASALEAVKAAHQERDTCMQQVAELCVAERCMRQALAEQDACFARTTADAQRAVEERAALKAQVQHSVDAASEQLQTATREAAYQVRDAEQRAASLRRELDELRQTLVTERADAAAARDAAAEQRDAQSRSLDDVSSERDGAQQELRKVRGELEALRQHLLENEEACCRRERQLSDQLRTLQDAMDDVNARRLRAEAAAMACESRAGGAESALASAERRIAEQATALSNLQTVIEQLQLQASGPSEELAQLRLGGRLLATELRQLEDEHVDVALARDELPLVRAQLEEELATSAQRQDQVASLQALLRAAKAEHAHDAIIDKQLVASVLVKYVQGDNSAEVLAVLASMLGCSQAQRQSLGLVPRTVTAHPDAKLSDLWTDFLLAEAGDGPAGSSSR